MIASLKEVTAYAKEHKVAIGSFNTPNLECLNAVLDAAQTLNVPIIIMHAQCHEDVAPIDRIGRCMVELAKASKVPVCVHLDHGEDYEYCKRAVDMGFTSVMIDNSAMSYDDNIINTLKVVEYAHAHGVDVEAELGRLPSREGGEEINMSKPEDLYTNPKLAGEFVERTGVDALAIAFGTAHGIYKVKPILNMDIISQVAANTDVPLVMHGGSGISVEEYKEVIRRGIAKINYYTYMSYAGYAAAKACIGKQENGFYHDLALHAQKAMEENVLNTLKVFTGK